MAAKEHSRTDLRSTAEERTGHAPRDRGASGNRFRTRKWLDGPLGVVNCRPAGDHCNRPPEGVVFAGQRSLDFNGGATVVVPTPPPPPQTTSTPYPPPPPPT